MTFERDYKTNINHEQDASYADGSIGTNAAAVADGGHMVTGRRSDAKQRELDFDFV